MKERSEREVAIQKAAQEAEQEATIAIQMAKEEATSAIQRAKEEFEGELRTRELQILDAAEAECNDAWRGREESLKREFQILLSEELEGLKGELSAHYDLLLGAKDEELELAAKKMAEAEELHQRQLKVLGEETERMAEVLWHDACEQIDEAAEETIDRVEQLRRENTELQTLVGDKTKQIEARERDLVDMQRANERELANMQRELAESVSRVETSCSIKLAALSDDVEKLSSERRKILLAYEEAENECEIMKEELGRVVSDLELRCREQTQTAQTFEAERDRLRSQVGELTACKELLQRQAADLAHEKAELVERCRTLDRASNESKLVNDGLAREITRLSGEAEEARRENTRINRELGDANQALAALKQERREAAAETDRRLKQKDGMLADALASIKRTSSETTAREPVVVHLHGDQNRVSGDDSSRFERNELQSKVLRLQRENLRLESESSSGLDQRAAATESKDLLNERVETLVQENARLKRMIQMMRKELESIASPEISADNGGVNTEANKSRDNALANQLHQCREYLDVLLETKYTPLGSREEGSEVAYLRSRLRSQDQVIDELQAELITLQLDDNNKGRINNTSCLREQELIQRLEETTDEVEALLRENDRLLRLSNELRTKLLQYKPSPRPSASSSADAGLPHLGTVAYPSLDDAILAETSIGNIDDVEEQSVQQACVVGRKPPLANSNPDSRPSRTAYGGFMPDISTSASGRATESQLEALRKMISRKKKELVVEKRIRNWNVKGDRG
ncbi:hypothetical protein THAOC_27986 [Thalassiosira oceanica]|uniref:Uncharacterized protein n=1 Tax=Thalassiosira oceanica TaxID=159749 RepID=K0RV80_THAOC|nr:hypothetical protein THAOC_27986 [Thalassiosira oceanica]|eukprot:EJK52706.1 hypothetical protein THAOC_27986 [Thalassiosira oceanica]